MLLAFVCRPLAAAEPSSTDMERAEAKAIEAKAFFQSGLFARAADGFMQAFAISKKPEMMFNAARAYEEAAMRAEAIALFEQYCKLADATDGGRKDAREHTARQRGILNGTATPVKATETATKPAEIPVKTMPAPPPPPAVTKPVRTAPAQVAVPPVKTPSGIAAAEPPAPTRSKTVTICLLVGGGLLVLGALAGWSDSVKQMNSANSMDFSVANAQQSYNSRVTAARDQRTSDIYAGLVGAGLAGWGAWRMWGPEPRATPTANNTWLAPTLSATTAGMALGGSF